MEAVCKLDREVNTISVTLAFPVTTVLGILLAVMGFVTTVLVMLALSIAQRQVFEDEKATFLREQLLDVSILSSTKECKDITNLNVMLIFILFYGFSGFFLLSHEFNTSSKFCTANKSCQEKSAHKIHH